MTEQSEKTMPKPSTRSKLLVALCFFLLVVALGELAMVIALKNTSPSMAPGDKVAKFPISVLVVTMFKPEMEPWLEHEKFQQTIKVPGAYDTLHCTEKGMCVTMLGKSKANAATSMMAILLDPQLSLEKTYFISVGIAGTKPSVGTLGFAAWARWVVDWDQGIHVLPETSTERPFGYEPDTSSDTTVFHLNENLATLAYNVTQNLELSDSEEAIAVRQKYPGQEDQHPYVALCDTIAGDDFWAGQQLSDKADYIMAQLTENQGKYCTTAQEDIVVAAALQRMGYLDRYLSLRTGSDFDQPHEGQTLDELLTNFPGEDIAVANSYLVGSTMANYLINNPVTQ